MSPEAVLRRKQNRVAANAHRLTLQQQDGKARKKQKRNFTTFAKDLTGPSKAFAKLELHDFSSRFSLVGDLANLTGFFARERGLRC